jgi:hypothetical protein
LRLSEVWIYYVWDILSLINQIVKQAFDSFTFI